MNSTRSKRFRPSLTLPTSTSALSLPNISHRSPPPKLIARNTSTFHFTELPPEIRNAIYSLVLPHNQIIKPHVSVLFRDAARHESGTRPFPSHEMKLTLARTCKQICEEVIAFYFRRNTFNFQNVYDFYRYLHMIGPERRRHIEFVQVFLVNSDHVQVRRLRGRRSKALPYEKVQRWAFDLLQDAVNLKRLWLGMEVWGPGGALKTLTLAEFKHREVWDFWCAKADLEVMVRSAWLCGKPWGSDWTANWD